LSGVALICDLVVTDLSGGSYRDRHGPPRLSVGTISGAQGIRLPNKNPLLGQLEGPHTFDDASPVSLVAERLLRYADVVGESVDRPPARPVFGCAARRVTETNRRQSEGTLPPIRTDLGTIRFANRRSRGCASGEPADRSPQLRRNVVETRAIIVGSKIRARPRRYMTINA